MRSFGFTAGLAFTALALGVVAITRGQYLIGACFIGIGLLRGASLLQIRQSRDPQPEIRLDITKPPELRCPPLPSFIQGQLAAVSPQLDEQLRFYPCRVRLRDGSEFNPVHFASERAYLEHYGMYPAHEISSADIASLEPASPTPTAPAWCLYAE